MILVDTNVLVAAAVQADTNHQVAVGLLQRLVNPLGVVPTVVAEACYLIERMVGPGAEASLLNDIARGSLRNVALTAADFSRMSALVTQYDNLPLGGTDASVVAAAERLGVSTIVTFDRHFRIVVPNHVPAFTVIP